MTALNGATVQITIDRAALAANYRHLAHCSGSAQCGAAVKANAYGCGINEVIPTLLAENCAAFFVADCFEGIKVRKLAPHTDIYILNGLFHETIHHIKDHNLIPILNSAYQVELYKNSGLTGPYALHIDTGMNRLGVRMDEAHDILNQSAIKPTLIMSHFACADDPIHPKNTAQLNAFATIRAAYPDLPASMANSAATLTNQAAHFDLTRPGIGLYGGNPFDTLNPVQSVQIQSVMQVSAQIINLRHVPKGETVSYGARFQATRDMLVATCGIGYADGLPRLSSVNPGCQLQGFYRGKNINALGVVTMDLTMFDVTDLANKSRIGDWVEIIGPNCKVDDLATATNTISYEVLTSLGRARH